MYKAIIKDFHVDRLTWKDLFNDFEMHFYRYVFPYYDTLYTLEKLTSSGYLTGVIANGKSKIKQFRMHTLGVEDAINYLSTSETVGYRKPHPKIFEDMLSQLGTKPEETMYVGDDPLNDVAPARAMGMISVWFKEDDDVEVEPLPEEIDFTIRSTEELLTILSIAKKGR